MQDINLVDIIIYMFNFAVTFTLLYMLLYRPVSKFLGDRRSRIASTLKEAEQFRTEAENMRQEAKAELANTSEKARQLSHEAIENAALDAENILDNAQEEAAAILARAREQVEVERKAALERAFTELVSLAGALASRILSREVSLDDNRKIVDEFFSEKAMKDEGSKAAEAEGRANNESMSKERKMS